jgi:hypothetical protein
VTTHTTCSWGIRRLGEAFKLVFDPTKWGVRMLELEKNGILPALISYTVPYADILTDTDGWDWIKIALRSFHVHFPGEKVLVVDNDMEDERYAGKRAWLHAHPDAIVIRNPATRDFRFWKDHNPRDNHHHGTGIDLAVAYCRRQGYAFLLYFEPDCLVCGTVWVDNMWEGMERGAWVAGPNTASHSDRIIHPCPSIWRIDSSCCRTTFLRQSKGVDRQHPLYPALTGFDDVAMNWDAWDTAQKNWWVAALQGKAFRSHFPHREFIHYWNGSGFLGKRSVRAQRDYWMFEPYLHESVTGGRSS